MILMKESWRDKYAVCLTRGTCRFRFTGLCKRGAGSSPGPPQLSEAPCARHACAELDLAGPPRPQAGDTRPEDTPGPAASERGCSHVLHPSPHLCRTTIPQALHAQCTSPAEAGRLRLALCGLLRATLPAPATRPQGPGALVDKAPESDLAVFPRLAT